MRKLSYILLLITTTILACNHEEALPKEILNEEQMINAIVDLEYNQALYKLRFANKDSVDYNQLVDLSFEKQNITKEQFNKSMVYYAKYPKKIERFYEKAIVILSKRQAEIQLNTSK